MKDFDPLTEIRHQLEALDQLQALLQAHNHLASRYAQWCNEMFAELDCRRNYLWQLTSDWEEANELYAE